MSTQLLNTLNTRKYKITEGFVPTADEPSPKTSSSEKLNPTSLLQKLRELASKFVGMNEGNDLDSQLKQSEIDLANARSQVRDQQSEMIRQIQEQKIAARDNNRINK